jgi:PAS domain S-box-containing protein
VDPVPYYEEIFNHAYEFEGLLDPDGTLRYVNDPALEFGGVTRDEVVGTKLWETEWLNWSERVRRQVRADIRRAANGEFVRHELEAHGKDRRAIVDFSINPFTAESGAKWLLVEGRDITQTKRFEGVSSRIPPDLVADDLLVTYSRDGDEAMSHSIIEAFLALDLDIFDRETTLQDWIDTDALDGMAWSAERPLTIVTRIWGYKLALSAGEVRIYADA